MNFYEPEFTQSHCKPKHARVSLTHTWTIFLPNLLLSFYSTYFLNHVSKRNFSINFKYVELLIPWYTWNGGRAWGSPGKWSFTQPCLQGSTRWVHLLQCTTVYHRNIPILQFCVNLRNLEKCWRAST